jgi:CDP-diacylglycerol--glycerol-3-phosphate 3-phosphatidyltransferase
MTTANKITMARIGLIPVFVTFAIYYGRSVSAGNSQEWLRWVAVAVFGIAAASDGLDGFIARRYNQRTELGVILDPLADKGLLLAAIVALSFTDWGYELPVWFAVLVVARDLIVLAGGLALILMHGRAAVRTTWTGKAATALQMIVLVLVMLQHEVLRQHILFFQRELPLVWLDLPVLAAATFTLVSGVGYSARGIAQMHAGGLGDPTEWPKH